MKKKNQTITASLLTSRELYEEHIGEMPGGMEYRKALEALLAKFGVDQLQEMITKNTEKIKKRAIMKRDLAGLVDAEYEALSDLSRKEFWQWAVGMVDGLTEDVSNEVHLSYF
jgi:hypothetical protein